MINDTQLNSSSVVIVSGGGRGITAQCVIYLAQQYHCKFILLGRSQILDPEPEWSLSCQDESELKKQIMHCINNSVKVVKLSKPYQRLKK
jgi:NAD(P)-dependent dehydrogenase (short-subunit alcohol dehydrogenase family)